MKVPVEEYARKMGWNYRRVLKWFKKVGILHEKIFITENYEEAIEEYIPECFKTFYLEKCAGFCYGNNNTRIIAINPDKAKRLPLGKLSVFIHELSHATTINDYMGNLNEDWAYNLQHYIEAVLTIEQYAKKIRRNPLRIFNYSLTTIVRRILKFSRKKVARKYRKTIEEKIRKINFNTEGTIRELIEILNVVNEILYHFLLNEEYLLARRFLTYILYMN